MQEVVEMVQDAHMIRKIYDVEFIAAKYEQELIKESFVKGKLDLVRVNGRRERCPL